MNSIRSFKWMIFVIVLSTSCYQGVAQRTFVHEKQLDWQLELPPDHDELLHTVLLMGDIQYPSKQEGPLNLLKEKMQHAGRESTVILLGDLLYPGGLPDEESKTYDKARTDLDALLNSFDNYQGSILMVPGNHDWQNGRAEGWDHVQNEDAYIHSVFERDQVYVPGGGCPGPIEVPLSEDVVAVAIDSQWWLHQNEKPGPEDGCDFEDRAGMLVQIEDILRRNQGKKIIFVSHHPLYSVGNHGGFFAPSRWIFPLLDVHKALYIPLPGFLYTWYRKFFGSIQDLSHPEYKVFRTTLTRVFSDYSNLIYVSGHEHNLQYVEKENLYHVISGGGAPSTFIKKKKSKVDFARSGAGLAQLNFYKNGDVWVEYWSVVDDAEEGLLVFRKKLFNQPLYQSAQIEKELQDLDFRDSIVEVRLSDLYNKGKFVRFWMGDNYREVWDQPVALPVFDIGSEKGGLKILKRGGGQQTRSVRLEDASGKQYVLRSVNKYVEKALEEEMRNTIAEDAVQDAISASHPFAAVTVPVLADAAGVMHTNPKIVWVPDDPRLGIYRRDLANNVFLFEERPAGNREDVASFNRSEKIVSTPKVVDKTLDDHNDRVDQHAVARARIFDLFLNDWDRHDDQWRWARFRKDGLTLYRPIPRDRDQVYFVNEGVVMWLARQDFIQPKFQGFDYKIRNVRGLGFNARYFDRSFLTEPALDDWLATARSIQNAVSDSVIREAIEELPSAVYNQSGKEIEDKLISRRNGLDTYAEGLYRFLAKEVDVVGTNEREYFEVIRKPDGNTEVTVWALSSKKGRLKDRLYHREFLKDETKEIRLYGLKGKDKFTIQGEAPQAIRIRLVGGKNNDTIIDESKIGSWRKSLLVYDRKDKKNYIKKGKETRLMLSNNKSVNVYDRKQYKYDKTMPLLNAGFNVDDGFFVGGGVNVKRYNFRDSTQHKLTGTLAFATQAFSIRYQGLFSSFSRFFDLEITADISMPRNVDNFFGIGNETKRIEDNRSYHRVRYEYAWVNPSLSHTVEDKLKYQFGAFYQYFSVTDTANKFIGDMDQNSLDTAAFDRHHFTGLDASLEIDTRNDQVLPVRGLFWTTNARAFYGLNEEAKNFVRLQSDLRFYLSFKRDPRVVFAFRVGGAANIGEYEFFHSNFLGGRTNLRGFQSNRFAGDQSFYQNTEIRLKLLNLRNYIFNGQTGVYVFNDIGRVWVSGEKSSRWHDGYGVGIWLTPFDFTALTLSYNWSGDDQMVVFNFRFLF